MLHKIIFKQKVFIIPLVLTIVIFGLWKLNIFAINKVETKLNNVDCVSEQQIKKDLNLNGKNFLFINAKDLNGVLYKYPCIKDLQIDKVFPEKVIVKVEGRLPLARVVAFKQDKILSLDTLESSPSSQSALLDWNFPEIPQEQFLADNEGVVFATAKDSNLPILFLANEDIKMGRRFDENSFKKISTVFSKLYQLQFVSSDSAQLVFKAKITDNVLQIKTEQKLIFALEKDILRQVASLQLILQKAKIDLKPMEIIDLRFDKPVVTYFSKK